MTDDWHQLWQDQKTNWHIKKPHPHMTKNYHKLINSLQPSSTRILLPMCGKSEDLLWLYQKGLIVLGVEYVEEGIVTFFRENNLPFDRTEKQGTISYSTKDKRLIIYLEDVLQVSPALFEGSVGLVFDRAALVALPQDQEDDYVRIMLDIAPKRYMLEIPEYDPSLYKGAPRVILQDKLERLFGEFYNIELLEKERTTLPNFGLESYLRCTYLLTRKG